ncbi:hypothetical protein ACF3M1_05240 [Luteimonas sp. WGS1318]
MTALITNVEPDVSQMGSTPCARRRVGRSAQGAVMDAPTAFLL